MIYDKKVSTITDILTALDKFENKAEIIEAIKPSLFDIETDWHTEQYLRMANYELEIYKEMWEVLKAKVPNIRDGEPLATMKDLEKKYDI